MGNKVFVYSRQLIITAYFSNIIINLKNVS